MTGGKSCGVCKIVGLLVAIGAINWGLVGIFQFNLVETLLGSWPGVVKVVYGLVGIAGILKLLSLVKCCPCQKEGCEPKKSS